MTPSQIVLLARDISWDVSVSQISDAQMYIYFNIVYKDLVKYIMARNDNRFLISWDASLVAWQIKYSLAPSSSGNFGQYKVKYADVKYSATSDYYRADLIEWDNLHHPIEWYEKNVSKYKPQIIVWAEEIYLFPKPDNSIVDWLRIGAIQKPYDITDTMTEEDILIPAEFHEVIAFGIRYYVFLFRNLLNEARVAKQDYEKERLTMMRGLSAIKNTPKIMEVPLRTYNYWNV